MRSSTCSDCEKTSTFSCAPKRVRLVRGEGHGVSDQYEGGALNRLPPRQPGGGSERNIRSKFRAVLGG